MKWWELFSFLRDEEEILEGVFKKPSWKNFYHIYINFSEYIRKQNRVILDAEVPNELCVEALSLSKKKFFVKDNHLYRVSDVGLGSKYQSHQLYTAVEIYSRFGGECLEEVEEYGSCDISKYEATL